MKTSPMNTITRRAFIAAAAAALVGAVVFISASSHAAEANGKKTFTILHANDLHSAFLGLGPATDYTPFKLNDDETREEAEDNGNSRSLPCQNT